MTQCSNCYSALKEGEEFDLIRIQQWRTKVGGDECKHPDLDKTRTYCLPCAKTVRAAILKA